MLAFNWNTQLRKIINNSYLRYRFSTKMINKSFKDCKANFHLVIKHLYSDSCIMPMTHLKQEYPPYLDEIGYIYYIYKYVF